MASQASGRDPVEKLAEEFAERYRRGERPSLTEYTDRYPELAEQIRDLFPALVEIEQFGSFEGPPTGPHIPTAPGDDWLPRQLGEYRILRQVGRGGMGVVYEAVQESLGRHVALKVLPMHGLLSPMHRERFRRETRAAARLHHTNIVPVFGVGQDSGIHYYAMQFIQGQSFDAILSELKRLREGSAKPAGAGAEHELSVCVAQGLISGQFAHPPHPGPELPGSSDPTCELSGSGTQFVHQSVAQYFRSVAQVGVQVAEALAHAHRQGILHRDIKPSNLILDLQGTVWITDFGLAKTEGSDDLTHPGDIVGTLRFMAPERFAGRCDRRSEVYSVGITLYELLTLQPAFEASDRPRLIERVLHEDPPRPRRIDSHIPRDLETIVMRAMAKDPAERYATAEALAEDLRRFLADRPIRARRTSMLEHAWRWCRRNPAVAALASSVVLLLTVIALVSSVAVVRLRQERDAAVRAREDHARQYELTLGERVRAESAERVALEHRFNSYLANLEKARARRWSGLAGRRFESLAALREAARIARELHMPEERILELRNEAVAGTALVDLGIGPQWEGFAPGTTMLTVDGTLQRYARSDETGTLSVRRVPDDREILRLPGPGIKAQFLQFSPDGQYLAAVHHQRSPFQVWIWDLKRGAVTFKLDPGIHTNGLDFSPDSRQVAIGQVDGMVHLYELPSGKEIKRVSPNLHISSAVAIRFHPNGRKLAVAGQKSQGVEIHDLETGAVTRLKHPEIVYAIAWRGDGKLLAAACGDSHLYVWDANDPRQPLAVLKGHLAQVVRVAFSHDGDLLASQGWDSTTRLWDPLTGRQLVSIPGAIGDYILQFGPGDRLLSCGREGSRINLWHVAAGRECRTFRGHEQVSYRQYIATSSIHPNGRLMASGGEDGVRLWDLVPTGEASPQLAFLPLLDCWSVHFHPDGKSMITCSKAGLQRWPLQEDPETSVLHIGPPRTLLALPSGGTAASIANGKTIAIVPDNRRAMVFDIDHPGRKVAIDNQSLGSSFIRSSMWSISPDGKWLAHGTWQGNGVKVWDSQTGKQVVNLPAGYTATVAFSPDGKSLVTSTGQECCFWEVGTWETGLRITREGASRSGGNLVYSPDGRMLAVAHSLTQVRLLDPRTGKELATLPASGGPLGFTPDGSRLVTYAENLTLQVWDLRLIRRQLAELGLDWDLTPYAPLEDAPERLEVRVDLGAPAKGLKPSARTQADQLRLEVEKYSQAIARDPNDAEAHYQRGRLYTRLKDFPRSLDDFNRAIALRPDHFESYHHRGHAYEGLQQPQKAIDDFSTALKRQGQSAHLYHVRGHSYLQLKEYAKAVADLNRALEIKLPTEAQEANASNSLAWVQVAGPAEFRAPDKALPLAQRAVQLAPGSWAYCHTLGVAHYRLGQYKEAVAALERAVKINQGQATAFHLYFLAMGHAKLDDPDKAHACYEQAVAWQKQAKLRPEELEDLNAFRTEAESVLQKCNP